MSTQHQSIWQGTSPVTNYPTLSKKDLTDGILADVIVVGGGLAGITTAFFLQRAGKNVIVLEANHIGEGVSGQTTAHITVAHEMIYDHLITHFGQDAAKTYITANQTAIEMIEKLVNELKLECDFQRVDEYVFADNVAQLPALEKEFAALQRLGFPAERLEKASVKFPTIGAIKYPNQAKYHPRKYLVQLAEKFCALGGKIFEETRVLNVKEVSPCIVETAQGNLTANDVVIATNAPILDRGGFFARMRPERSYVIAAKVKETLSDDMFDSAEDPTHYLRSQRTKDGTLLVIGGEDHGTGYKVDTEERFARLEAYARARFTLESIEYRWSSQDNYTLDNVPFIGYYTPVSKHLFVATGFNGWGMTTSMVSGLLLSDLILKKKNAWEKLFSPQRFKPLLEVPVMMKTGLRMMENLVTAKVGSKKYPVFAHVRDVQLKPGTTKIVKIAGQLVAVYKDRRSVIHAVAAECTHMGCGLEFNTAEESWDCPCHGSRFSIDGEVLHTPAVKPLKNFSQG